MSMVQKVFSFIIVVLGGVELTTSGLKVFLGVTGMRLFFLTAVFLGIIIDVYKRSSKKSPFQNAKKKWKLALATIVICYLISLFAIVFYNRILDSFFLNNNVYLIVNDFERKESQSFSETVVANLIEQVHEKSIDSIEIDVSSERISVSDNGGTVKNMFASRRIKKGIFIFGNYNVESTGNNSLQASIFIHNMPTHELYYQTKNRELPIKIPSLDTLNIRMEKKAFLLSQFILAILYQRQLSYEASQSALSVLLKDSASMYPSFKYHCLRLAGINHVALQDFKSALDCFESANVTMPESMEVKEIVSHLSDIVFMDTTQYKARVVKGQNGKYKISIGSPSLRGFIYDSIIMYRKMFILKKQATFTYFDEEMMQEELMPIKDWGDAREYLNKIYGRGK
jgi:hypothetical protein